MPHAASIHIEVNIRCPFRIERDAASVRADPGAVIALLLRCVLSQLSVERDPAVFENLDARPVADRAGRRKIQKRAKIDTTQVFKKVHICLLHRLSNQLHLHHRGPRSKIQLTSYINFSPEIRIISRYIVAGKFGIIKCSLFKRRYISDKSGCLSTGKLIQRA